ncbi:MAG: hypothetical protein JNM82_14210, partial [Rhodocyclaceae bacterium]|nr:hypothetical protein [Rhodocyclaceae bacterium]
MAYTDAGSLDTTALDLGILNPFENIALNGTLGSADPGDVFRVTLSADSDLEITLNGLTANRDVDVVITDSSGFQIYGGSRRYGSLVDIFTLAGLAAGDYFIRVFPFEFSGALDYTYNLTVAANPPTASRVRFEDVFVPINEDSSLGYSPTVVVLNRSGNTAGAATVGWSVPLAAVGAGNSASAADFSAGTTSGIATFAAGEGTATLTLWIMGDATPEGNENFSIELKDPSAGMILDSNDAVATGNIIDDDGFPTVTAGIRALDSTGAPTYGTGYRTEGNSGTGDFRFAVTLSSPLASAQTLAWRVGSDDATKEDFAGGAIPSGTVTFAAGQTLQILTVRIAGDTLVEGDQSFQVELLNPNSSVIVGDGSYTQGVIVDNDDDFANTATASLADLGLGNSLIGNISSASDVDVFRITLWQGIGAHFAVQPTGSGFGSFGLDPRLELLDSAGNVLAISDNGGGALSARIGIVPPADGTYYLRVSGTGGSQGEYALSTRTSPGDDLGNGILTPGYLAPGGMVAGWMESSYPNEDADSYRTVLEAGKRYSLYLQHADDLRLAVEIVDPATGNAVQPDSDFGPPHTSPDGYAYRSIQFTAPASGDYVVRVKGVQPGNNLGQYLVSLDPMDEFSGTGAA